MYAKFKTGDLVKFSNLCTKVYEGDTTNSSCEPHIITVIVVVTIPNYYQESFLKDTMKCSWRKRLQENRTSILYLKIWI